MKQAGRRAVEVGVRSTLENALEVKDRGATRAAAGSGSPHRGSGIAKDKAEAERGLLGLLKGKLAGSDEEPPVLRLHARNRRRDHRSP